MMTMKLRSVSVGYSVFVFFHWVASCCSIRYHLQTFRQSRNEQDSLKHKFSTVPNEISMCGSLGICPSYILWVVFVGNRDGNGR